MKKSSGAKLAAYHKTLLFTIPLHLRVSLNMENHTSSTPLLELSSDLIHYIADFLLMEN